MDTETTVPPEIVTVAVAVVEPDAFVAVSVYVVVCTGVTRTEVPLTVPIPGAMLSEVAPLTDQFRVALCPAEMLEGDAAKLTITGTAEAVPNLPN